MPSKIQIKWFLLAIFFPNNIDKWMTKALSKKATFEERKSFYDHAGKALDSSKIYYDEKTKYIILHFRNFKYLAFYQSNGAGKTHTNLAYTELETAKSLIEVGIRDADEAEQILEIATRKKLSDILPILIKTRLVENADDISEMSQQYYMEAERGVAENIKTLLAFGVPKTQLRTQFNDRHGYTENKTLRQNIKILADNDVNIPELYSRCNRILFTENHDTLSYLVSDMRIYDTNTLADYAGRFQF